MAKKNFTLVHAAQSVATFAHNDLAARREELRDKMLWHVDANFNMMYRQLFAPVDYSAVRGHLDPAPDDPARGRLSPELEQQFFELRKSMVELVRKASIVRGPADRGGLSLVG